MSAEASTGTASREDAILSVRGVRNHFGSQVVHDDISFDVMPGEVLGIAGGSGSGKSVLLKTLIGLRPPDAGSVLIDGKPIADITSEEKAELIGVLFQQGALFSSLTVAQNIMLPIRLHTTLAENEQQSIAAMKLALTGLPAASGGKYPAEISGGMIKRAAFARALALDPRILFLDEPTSGLDPLAASGIDELIAQMNRGLGITVVMVTHDLTTLLSTCSRIAFLVDKKITVDTPDNMMKSEQPWIREFLHGSRAQHALNARK
jgi:phospholipid/cholesterol/gamma-HCH transport system ATP-binding protein